MTYYEADDDFSIEARERQLAERAAKRALLVAPALISVAVVSIALSTGALFAERSLFAHAVGYFLAGLIVPLCTSFAARLRIMRSPGASASKSLLRWGTAANVAAVVLAVSHALELSRRLF